MLLSLKHFKSLILFTFLLNASLLFGQGGFVNQGYDWTKEIETVTIPDSLADEPQIFFLKRQIVEFGFEGEDFKQLSVVHEKFWVNSDEAIDKNNKVYIPMGKDNEGLIETKARVLNPDGKVVSLKKEDIEQITDENDNTLFYFALKGIEKGSVIEYFHVIKTAPNYKGRRKVAQEDAPVFNYRFDLYSPEFLVFETKSYNGFGVPDEDSSDEERQHLIVRHDYIPKFEKEAEAYNFPNKMAVIYKLDENTRANRKDLVNYKSVGDFFLTYSTGTKSDMKGYKKMMKAAKIDPTLSNEMKVRALEKYIKKNYSIIELYSGADMLEDLSQIVKNKYLNPRGFIKFMSIACDEYGIDHQVVMTSNRKNVAFDKKFQTNMFLQKFLMYFPSLKMFMDMEEQLSCLGYVDYHYQDNYGVFFKTVNVNGIQSSVAKINFIEGREAMASRSDMDMTIQVEDDFSTLNFDLTTEATGYNASVQSYFGLVNPEDSIEMAESLMKWVDEDMDLKEVKPENTGFENYGIKPLVMNGKFSIDKYIVPVKDKYLIKLGLVIGPQAELYQDLEKPRQYPVDMGYRKSYHRVIKFVIPEGYSATNLEALNMQIESKDQAGNVFADFISTYTVDGNVITITCDERYHKIHFPVEEYEDYRKVINAAADFNKIVIYLEQKN